MVTRKERDGLISAASQRNPSLRRLLEDIYERIDAAEAAAAPAKKSGRRSPTSGGRK